MDIAKAKEQVKNTVTAYLSKDGFGSYLIGLENQRPVFLMGPPGIGKTAIMAQVADEMGIGFVSYSMTHHTRQSALGLPYIDTQRFGGREYRVTHYTMSEIVASVYEVMEQSGMAEGILFLDEVNCVSETLAPAMLQFLQFKVFGQHRIPQGWVIACAGNPPEYNNSVREFDIVTWDRLKRIDIEPSYEAWRAYAIDTGVHPVVTTYLDLKKQHFYKVESTADGKRFVTARAWVDLSSMIALYERNDIEVDGDLIVQYVQDPDIARDFASYYRLFSKYKADYCIEGILTGDYDPAIALRARKAAFDERLALVGMLLDACLSRVAECLECRSALEEEKRIVAQVRELPEGASCLELLHERLTELGQRLETPDASASASAKRTRRVDERLRASLERHASRLAAAADASAALMEAYAGHVGEFKTQVSECKASLDAAFRFLEDAFGEGQEMLVFVTDLTANTQAADFIARYGCEKYFEHNKELLFYERQKEIVEELSELEF